MLMIFLRSLRFGGGDEVDTEFSEAELAPKVLDGVSLVVELEAKEEEAPKLVLSVVEDIRGDDTNREDEKPELVLADNSVPVVVDENREDKAGEEGADPEIVLKVVERFFAVVGTVFGGFE